MELEIPEALAFAESEWSKGNGALAQQIAEQISRAVPKEIKAWELLGKMAYSQGNAEKTKACMREILKYHPSQVFAHNMLGIVHTQLREFELGIEHFGKVAELQPNSITYRHLGMAYHDSGDLKQAELSFRKAIGFNEEFAQCWGNLGNVLRDQGDVSQAKVCFEKVIQLDPDCPDAFFDQSFLHLIEGNYVEGWKNYEYRLKMEGWAEIPLNPLNKPRWDGESIEGLKVYICYEIGFGDTIQFFRYILELEKRGIELIACVQSPLLTLFQHQVSKTRFVDPKESPIEYDCYLPLHSVPFVLKSGIPFRDKYICVKERDGQSQGLVSESSSFKVGIVWSGNPDEKRTQFKSIPLSAFEKMLKIENVEIYSLQKGEAEKELLTIACRDKIFPLGKKFDDFYDTALAIKNLDLVICVCSSVAHLSAAMGKRTWALLSKAPYWCWGISGESSDWYASVRCFRQEEWMDWAFVIDEVTHELQELVKNS